MVFSSLVFLFVYFPITLFIMKIAPIKYRNFILLIVSLFFYGWSEPKYIILMIISCIVNYYFGHLITIKKNDAKKILVLLVIFNLGLLGFFKYYDFFVGIINSLMGKRFNFSTIYITFNINALTLFSKYHRNIKLFCTHTSDSYA